MSAKEIQNSMVRGTGIVGSLTLVSRVLGFVRDMLVARLFGSGLYADAFFVAFRIPNLLRSLVAEGALTSAFVPVFASELKQGKEEAQSAFSSVMGLLLLTTALLSVVGIYLASTIVAFFAPGFGVGTEKFELCVLLTQVMLPYIMFVSVIALLNGALNSVKIFGSSALAQVVMNVVLILGAWAAMYLESRAGVIALAVSVMVGGAAQLVAQVPALRRSGFSLAPSLHVFTPVTRQLLKLMLPAVVGATVYQLTIFLNTVMASLLREGSVSWLFYADRLTQLPIGIFSIALASVLLPTLSQAHVEKNRELFVKNLIDALRYTSFFMIPMACGMFCLARPLIEILFERGQFGAESTYQTSRAVQAYALGLWAMSCHSMVARGFIAQKDTVTSTLTGVLSLFLTVTFSLLFIGDLSPQAGTMYQVVSALRAPLISVAPTLALGHAGLALASSISATVAFLTLSLLFHKRLGGIDWKPFAIGTLKTAIASAVMCGVILALVSVIKTTELQLAVAIPMGMSAFALSCLVFKSAELNETVRMLKRYIRR